MAIDVEQIDISRDEAMSGLNHLYELFSREQRKKDDNSAIKNMTEFLRAKEKKAFGIFWDEKLIGAACLLSKNNALFLDFIYVEEEFRNQGAGSALLSAVTKHLIKTWDMRPFIIDLGFTEGAERLSDFLEKDGLFFVDFPYGFHYAVSADCRKNSSFYQAFLSGSALSPKKPMPLGDIPRHMRNDLFIKLASEKDQPPKHTDKYDTSLSFAIPDDNGISAAVLVYTDQKTPVIDALYIRDGIGAEVVLRAALRLLEKAYREKDFYFNGESHALERLRVLLFDGEVEKKGHRIAHWNRLDMSLYDQFKLY